VINFSDAADLCSGASTGVKHNQVLTGWTGTAEAFFAKTGTLIEKYASTDPMQDPRASRGYQDAQIGFGWTNGVSLEALLMLMDDYR